MLNHQAQKSIALRNLIDSSSRQIWHACMKGQAKKIAHALEKVRYRELWRDQLTNQQANALIIRLLSNSRPFLVGRIGHTEGRIVGESFFRNGQYGRMTKKEAHQYSGIFPVTPELLSSFASIYAASVAKVDLLGFWQTAYQARLLATHHPQIPLAPLASLEPYLQPSPWSAALQGRRVLVVHPFAETIMYQYANNRMGLFANPAILPDFDLQVLSPPQTLAPLTAGYVNWLEALEHLTENVLRRQFDLALLGCGAYGLPLGAAIKDAGLQAIHLGGALQVLFGIRGKRWEKMPGIAALMNEHWRRPAEVETPVSAACVDGGCYW